MSGSYCQSYQAESMNFKMKELVLPNHLPSLAGWILKQIHWI